MKRDPVCGREVDPLRARGVAIVGGEQHYFCSVEHKREFLARRHDWDEPTPLPPVVAPEREGTAPLPLIVAPRRQRRGLFAYIVGLLRRFTL